MDNVATIYVNRGEGKFNSNHRKENHFNAEYMAICPRTGRKIATLKTYWTGARYYAAFWYGGTVNGARVHNSGTGWAGGCGYCRESAAAAEAIANAHIKLDVDIHGRGTNEIEPALRAISTALGYASGAFIIKANG